MVYAVSGTNKKMKVIKRKLANVDIVQCTLYIRVANDVAHHEKFLTQRRYM